MANVQFVGVLKSIRVMPMDKGVAITVHEFKKGYRKKNGDVVTDRWNEWRVMYVKSLIPYVTEHFGRGMMVEIKGEIIPYAMVDDKPVDGYTILGQTLNMASIPRPYALQEQKMIKDSQANATDKPDLDAYNDPDF